MPCIRGFHATPLFHLGNAFFMPLVHPNTSRLQATPLPAIPESTLRLRSPPRTSAGHVEDGVGLRLIELRQKLAGLGGGHHPKLDAAGCRLVPDLVEDRKLA